jgi:hypothetical protein
MKKKITTGPVRLILLPGRVRCGGAAVRPPPTQQAVSLLSTSFTPIKILMGKKKS